MSRLTRQLIRAGRVLIDPPHAIELIVNGRRNRRLGFPKTAVDLDGFSNCRVAITHIRRIETRGPKHQALAVDVSVTKAKGHLRRSLGESFTTTVTWVAPTTGNLLERLNTAPATNPATIDPETLYASLRIDGDGGNSDLPSNAL